MLLTPKRVFFCTVIPLSGVALLLAQFRSEHPEYQIRLVTTMTSLTKSSPENTPTISKLHFGRRDGSVGVRTTEIVNGRPCTTTMTWNAETREQVTASDCVAMKSTTFLDRVPYRVAGHAVPTCAKFLAMGNLAGVENIQGLKVERFESDTKSARTIVYAAPDLGCLMVRAAHYWKGSDGKVTSTTFEEPFDVRVGSYDPSLFSIPVDYREVLPSERRNAQDKYFRNAAVAAACLRKGNEREDKHYIEANKARGSNGLMAKMARLGRGWFHDRQVTNK